MLGEVTTRVVAAASVRAAVAVRVILAEAVVERRAVDLPAIMMNVAMVVMLVAAMAAKVGMAMVETHKKKHR